MFQRNQNIANYTVNLLLQESSSFWLYRVLGQNKQVFLLKVFKPEYNDRFEAEVQILKSVPQPQFPKLIETLDILYQGNMFKAYLTQYVSASTLVNYWRFKHSELTTSDITDFFKHLLKLTQHLHEQGIIYANLNQYGISVSLNQELTPLMMDFSRSVAEQQVISLDDLPFDAMMFYPDEVLRQEAATTRADVFSLGAVFYFLLHYSPPWWNSQIPAQKEEYADFIINLRKNLPLPIQGRSDLDPRYLEAIMHSITPQIEERFANAKEYLDFLTKKAVPITNRPNAKPTDFTPEQTSEPKANQPRGFEKLAGMQELKRIIHRDIIAILKEPELSKQYGLTIPNGILLYGPPGCGKTFFAQCLAEELNFKFFHVTPSELGSIYIHGAQEKIAKLFNNAKQNAPAIIFLDEIDALAPNRASNLDHSYSTEVNELLVQMNNIGEKQVLVIAATNRPERLDPALLRTGRIDKVFYVPPPDKETRRQLFELYLKNRPVEQINYELLAEKTELYSASDIEFICKEAAREAFFNKQKITNELLLKVIQNTPSSINKEELRKYQDFGLRQNDRFWLSRRKITGFGQKE